MGVLFRPAAASLSAAALVPLPIGAIAAGIGAGGGGGSPPVPGGGGGGGGGGTLGPLQHYTRYTMDYMRGIKNILHYPNFVLSTASTITVTN